MHVRDEIFVVLLKSTYHYQKIELFLNDIKSWFGCWRTRHKSIRLNFKYSDFLEYCEPVVPYNFLKIGIQLDTI